MKYIIQKKLKEEMINFIGEKFFKKKLAELSQLIWKAWSRIFKISTHNDTHKMPQAFKTILTQLSSVNEGGMAIKTFVLHSKETWAYVSQFPPQHQKS